MWTFLALIALMSVTRHQLRLLYLDPVLSKATLAELPQWGTFGVFAVILVLGLVTTGWMVWRVVQSRVTGDAAA